MASFTLKTMFNKLIQECKKEKLITYIMTIEENGTTMCMTVLPDELNVNEQEIKAFIEKEDSLKAAGKIKKHTKEYEIDQKLLDALSSYNKCLQARLNFDRNDYE